MVAKAHPKEGESPLCNVLPMSLQAMIPALDSDECCVDVGHRQCLVQELRLPERYNLILVPMDEEKGRGAASHMRDGIGQAYNISALLEWATNKAGLGVEALLIPLTLT